MKNLYSKGEFLNIYEQEQKNNDDLLNEGLFDFLGKMFNKAKTYINKIKGAQEIENIYNKYIKIIDDEFKKKAQVDLGLTADEQLNAEKSKETGKPVENKQDANTQSNVKTNTQSNVKTNTQSNVKTNGQSNGQSNDTEVSVKTESVNVIIKNRLNESDELNAIKNNEKDVQSGEIQNSEGEKNVKMTADSLKKKQVALQNILNLYQNKALAEMERVLTRMGGREKNVKLAIIIDNKKDEFRLAFLNAEITAFEKGGDKSSAMKLANDRNKLAKKLNAQWQNLDKATTVDLDVKIAGKDVKLTIGKPYRYKKDDGTLSVIEIKGKSDEDGKILAAYRSGDSAGVNQNFRLDNIIFDWKPEENSEYNYYSKEGKKIVKVSVDNYDENSKLAEVHIGENGDKFKVNAGALIDLPKNNTTQTTPAQNKVKNN